MEYLNRFCRKETKYIIGEEQYKYISEILCDNGMNMDKYGKSLVASLYFDTPDYRIIRRSMEKPKYKEKLRIRTYGVPGDDTDAFCEIKKKYKGIVYKRRVKMPYGEALDWLCSGDKVVSRSQIQKEIEYNRDHYPGIAPSVIILYDRVAYYSSVDQGLRVTFDTNVRYRFDSLDLRCGDFGEVLIGEGQYIMEVKRQGAIPLWLSHALGCGGVYPVSYSKYANAYIKEYYKRLKTEVFNYAK